MTYFAIRTRQEFYCGNIIADNFNRYIVNLCLSIQFTLADQCRMDDNIYNGNRGVGIGSCNNERMSLIPILGRKGMSKVVL